MGPFRFAMLAALSTVLLAAPSAHAFTIAPGEVKTLRFQLSEKTRRKLRRNGSLLLGATATNGDAADGTASRAAIRVK